MALPVLNAAKHHIGLKATVAADFFGFMLEGAWVKEPQREALGAPDFGGSTDLIGQAPSLARWTQDAFEGGMFAYEWGRDDAMFADCQGWMSQAQSRALLSCPPMFKKFALDSDSQAGWLSDQPKSMFMIAGSIYIVWGHAMARYEIDSGTLTWDAPPASSTFVFGEYESTDQVIWLICNTTISGDRPFLKRTKTDLTDPSFDSIMLGPEKTTNQKCFGGTIFNQKVVMQIGRKVFVGDPPDDHDPDVNGLVKWTKIGRLPGRWRDSIPYNELLYILVNDGSFKSNIFAFDGESLLPICTLPFNFYGKCIMEYAGRIYVGGTGTDVNGGEHYAELYEITGASVRLVRSFSPETRNAFLGGLAGEWPRSIDDMTVFEGMLWFCQKGKRMIAYDVTSDGFFGAAEIQSNTDLNFGKIISGRGRLWCYGIDDTDDLNHGIYRIAQPADAIGPWSAALVTSDFMYEPGVKKRWSEIQVMTRYGPVESIEYSVDSGATWTALSGSSENASNKVYFYTASLAGVAPSKLIRFRIKVDTDTPDSAVTYHRELVAITTSFSMLETGKMAWSFTINASENIETLDASELSGATSEATVQAYTPSEIRSQLWSWYTAKTPLTFRDLDGVDYTVALEHLREVRPVIAPGGEAHFAMTLVQV